MIKMLHEKQVILIILSIVSFLFSDSAFSQDYPYKNSSLPINERVENLLQLMTPEEKFRQLFMITGDLGEDSTRFKTGIFGFQINTEAQKKNAANQIMIYYSEQNIDDEINKLNSIQKYFVEQTRLGIPVIFFDEALHGLVRSGATSYPQSIAMAATFDTTLMNKVAVAIAQDCRARGIRQVLSPVVNLATDVRWGRVEETFGEDPILSSLMGVSYIKAFQEKGIVATPKHFAVNHGDGGRDSYPININENYLDQTYFVPFKAAIKEGKAKSIMTSYNSLNGRPCSANNWLLNKKLKQEWDFDGFVISDAGATGGANVLHFTAKDYADAGKQSIENGLDVIFQTNFDSYKLFSRQFLNGEVRSSAIDSAVARVLRVKFELGLFDDPYIEKISSEVDILAHHQIAKEASIKSIVLLKNDDKKILPLSASYKNIALIGVDAVQARLGGYSGFGNNVVSIFEGLSSSLKNKSVIKYAEGCGRKEIKWGPVNQEFLSHTEEGKSVYGLKGEYFNNLDFEGEPVLTRTDKNINFQWTLFSPDQSINYDFFSVRWNGYITSPSSGNYKIGIDGNDGYRLFINDKLTIDTWEMQSHRTTTTNYYFEKNIKYKIRVEYKEPSGNSQFSLIWNIGINNDSENKINEAVNLAKNSDIAIVVVGIEEGEFKDRSCLKLPGRQQDMILRVAETGKPIIVVIVGGSAITMNDWIDKVNAVLDVWYPGEAGGEAIAAILTGENSPSGKLPITFPLNEGQLPLYYNHLPTGRGDDYNDGTGLPLFPFGYGLSYTSFEYSNLICDNEKVSFNLKNSGGMDGEEVVQLYFYDEFSDYVRPIKELKGFQRVFLKAGKQKKVEFQLTPDMFSEPGFFRIMIGSSSKDIRLREKIEIKEKKEDNKYYTQDPDPAIRQRLEEWQDLKFGLLMHWGTYSQWGIVESWSICPEDLSWATGGRKKEYGENYNDYVKKYEQLQLTFNPVKFNPEKWAKAAKNAGMRYLVFTTKHHDGFCMFDSKFSEYKITDSKTPFSNNPRSNITKEVFSAFRKENFWIGAYFSKPDWHSDFYWWKRFPSVDRNCNYSIGKHPEQWKKFVNYTHNQIDELMSEYGKIDILWLDGGWVRKKSDEEVQNELKKFEENSRWTRNPQSQDVDMEGIVKNAREKQKNIIVVDRAVPGKFQNYLTPEQEIPEKGLPYPWETCMTMATSWSYVPGDRYKPADELIEKLVDIVSKGGNLLLNIGPNPDGELDTIAYERLEEIGAWMKVNGEAIYGTRMYKSYNEGENIRYTQSKSGNTEYVFFFDFPEEPIILNKLIVDKGDTIKMLGTSRPLKYQLLKNGTQINLPKKLKKEGKYVWVLKIKKKDICFRQKVEDAVNR
ncbi:MAG: alpha-L-fucosidase [Bacteroidales bacterium]|jgi:beta-glucosidase